MSFLSSPSFHSSTDVATPWPDRRDWAAAFGIALLLFGLEAYVATAIGRTQSLAYDGLGYALHARVKYFQLGSLLSDPFQYIGGFFNYIAGLWSVFLVLTFALVGVGEVQSFFGWFWFVVFFLLLVVWIVRVMADRTVAILLAVLTALLPLCSPMLALAINYQVGLDWLDVMEANLADSRPDPLAHTFMLWSVVPLLLHGRHAGTTTFVVTAIAAAASVLTKGTTAPLAVGCWGLAGLYVAWLQRDRLIGVLRSVVAAGIVFALLLGPWIAAGGLQAVLDYVRDAYAWKPFYEADSSVSNFVHFPFTHYFVVIKYFFSWPVIVVMAVVAAGGTFTAFQRDEHRVRVVLTGLALLTLGVLIPLSIQTLRNHYLGMPLYFLLWLYVVVAACSLWRRHADKPFIRKSVIVVMTMGFVSTASVGLLGAWTWPQDDLQRLLQGRALIREVAEDVKLHLTNRDVFAALVLASGWPAILQFHMTTDSTGYPASFRFWPPDGPAIARDPEARRQYITDLETHAKLIVTFKEPPQKVYRQARMSEFFLPHFEAIHHYLNSDRSRYRPIKEYTFPDPGRLFFPPAAGTVVMYLRNDVPNRL